MHRKQLKRLVEERDKVNYIQNLTSNEEDPNKSNFTIKSNSTSSAKITDDNSTMSSLRSKSSVSLSSATSNHLSVFSSFNCFADFPNSIADYLNDTFKNQFELGHIDIYEKDTKEDIDMLPILLDVRATCSLNNYCETYFQFDKQYGIETNYERTIAVDNMFYCCPFQETNKTSDTCKKATPLVKKSILKQSTYPMLMVSSLQTDINYDYFKLLHFFSIKLAKVNTSQEMFMTNVYKTYNSTKNETKSTSDKVLQMIQLPAPDILRQRLSTV